MKLGYYHLLSVIICPVLEVLLKINVFNPCHILLSFPFIDEAQRSELSFPGSCGAHAESGFNLISNSSVPVLGFLLKDIASQNKIDLFSGYLGV